MTIQTQTVKYNTFKISKFPTCCFKIYYDQFERIEKLHPEFFKDRTSVILNILRWSLAFFKDELLPKDFTVIREIRNMIPISLKIPQGLLLGINTFVAEQQKKEVELKRSQVFRNFIDLYFLNEDNRLLLCNNILYIEN